MELSLKDFLAVVRRKLWFIILTVFIISGATLVYQRSFVTPEYEASVKLVVNKERVSSTGTVDLDLNSVNTNMMLVNSYMEVLRTPFIMDEVAKRLADPTLAAGFLLQKVGITRVNETQVMTIYVIDEKYERAAKIVNTVAQVFKEKIPIVFKIDNVTILNYADAGANVSPVTGGSTSSVVVAFLASLLLGIGAALAIEFFDDRIKSVDSAEKALGQPILGVIATVKKSDYSVKQTNFHVGRGESAALPQ